MPNRASTGTGPVGSAWLPNRAPPARGRWGAGRGERGGAQGGLWLANRASTGTGPVGERVVARPGATGAGPVGLMGMGSWCEVVMPDTRQKTLWPAEPTDRVRAALLELFSKHRIVF